MNANQTNITNAIAALNTAQTNLATAQEEDAAAITAAQTAADEAATALAEAVSTLQTELTALGTANAEIKTITDLLTESIDLIKNAQTSSLDSLLASINALPNNTSISDLLTALSGAVTGSTEEIIAAILAANNVFTGDLNITNNAELSYAAALGDKVAIINGDVTITITEANELDVVAVSEITSKIASIIGNVTINTIESIDFSNLTAVSGDYAVAGNDVDDSALASVADVTLNYEGAYSQPALKTAGDIVITNKTSTVTGTISVDFSGLTSGTITDAASSSAGTLDLDSATSIVIGSGAPVISLTAPKALTVELHNAGTLASLTVDTVSATSVIVQATKVTGAATITATTDVTLAATTAGSLAISAGKLSAAALTASGATIITADEVSLPTLATLSAASTLTTEALTLGAIATVTGTLTLDGPTDINFPALTKADIINADTALSFSAGALTTSAAINTASATTMVLKSATVSHIEDLATLTALTLNAQATAFNAGAAAALTSLSVTGTSSSASTFAVGDAPKLVSVSLAGKFASATIEGDLAKLTTVSTAGLIETLTVSGTTALVSLNLAHTSADVSSLIVSNNSKLGSLTTSTDYLAELTVTGNSALTTADFSSYSNVVNDTAATASVTIAIGTNSLTATFTAATPASGATAFAEAKIVSASLATLSGYIQDVYDVDPAMISLSMNPAATTKGSTIAAFSTQNPSPAVTGSNLPAGAIASEEANALISAN